MELGRLIRRCAKVRVNVTDMASLTRCPGCSTFVRAESICEDSCPFCPTAAVATRRNPIPGIVLAAAIAVAPGCTGGSEDDSVPVYGVAVDAGVDAGSADATDDDSPDAAPIYGVAPESE